EAIFLQGLSDGITLVEDENNVGAGIRVDFKYLDKNKFGVVKKWGDDGFTPIADMKRVIEAAEGNVSVIMLSKDTYDLMRTSQEAKELAANYSGVLVLESSKLPVPLPNVFDAAFMSETGCAFKVVNRTVKIEKDGKVKSIPVWNRNKVIFLPQEEVGALVYGTLAEETNPVSAVNYSKANAYVLVSKYSKNDPLQEFTSAQALCLPIIENVDQIYQLDITEAQEVAAIETEGDATVTIWGQPYTKTDVIAALNTLGVRTAANISDANLIKKINELSDEQEEELRKLIES
ncbi:MAG: major capsid protein, partial [Cytophagaceae bacterium]|nr:major capsid protein [Cytophagaceae bacterium]